MLKHTLPTPIYAGLTRGRNSVVPHIEHYDSYVVLRDVDLPKLDRTDASTQDKNQVTTQENNVLDLYIPKYCGNDVMHRHTDDNDHSRTSPQGKSGCSTDFSKYQPEVKLTNNNRYGIYSKFPAANNKDDGCVTSRGSPPLVVFVHGGGWRRGHKQAWKHYLSVHDTNFLVWLLLRWMNVFDNIGQALATQGMACAVLTYPLCTPPLWCMMLELITSFVASNLITGVFLLFTLGMNFCWSLLVRTWLSSDHGMFVGSLAHFVQLTVMTSQIVTIIVMVFNHQRYQMGHKLTVTVLAGLAYIIYYLASSISTAFPPVNVATMLVLSVQGMLLYLKYTNTHPVLYHQQIDVIQCNIKHLQKFGKQTNMYNPERLFLMGHSAGAHLVSMVTINACRQGDALSEDVKGVIGVSGVYDIPALARNPLIRHMYVIPAFGSEPAAWLDASPLHCIRHLDTAGHSVKESSNHKLTCENNKVDTDGHLVKGSSSRSTTKSKPVESILPSFLLVNAKWDLSLLDQAKDFNTSLQNLGVTVWSHVDLNSNHFSIVGKFDVKNREAQVKGESHDVVDLTETVAKFVNRTL